MIVQRLRVLCRDIAKRLAELCLACCEKVQSAVGMLHNMDNASKIVRRSRTATRSSTRRRKTSVKSDGVTGFGIVCRTSAGAICSN